MTYSEKLKDPRWQKKRLEVLNRDNLCDNSESELQIHHKFYIKDRNPWEYDDSDLITLCRYCHEMKTVFTKPGMKIIEAFFDSKNNVDGITDIFYVIEKDEEILIATLYYEPGGDLKAGIVINKGEIEKMNEILEKHKQYSNAK